MFIYPVKKDAGHYTLVGQAQENVIVGSLYASFLPTSMTSELADC